MASVRLPGVHKVTSKGRTYYYAWRGKGAPRLPGKAGSPEFVAALNTAHESRRKPDTRRVSGLVHAYKDSRAWRDLAESTRGVWGRWLDRISDHFGPLPIAAFDRPEIKRDLRKWREIYASTPRTADLAMQVLSRLMSFAVSDGLVRSNPCLGIEHLYQVDRSGIIWTDEDLEKLQEHASPEVMWAARLACLTGLRQDDCRKLTWSEVGKHAIERRASKSRTGINYLVPIYAELQALLDEIKSAGRGSIQVLTNTRGQPWCESAWKFDPLSGVIGV